MCVFYFSSFEIKHYIQSNILKKALHYSLNVRVYDYRGGKHVGRCCVEAVAERGHILRHNYKAGRETQNSLIF